MRCYIASMRDHRKLRAFELADQVAIRVYVQTRTFPREELFGLTSQMRRAAISIPSNIVEGCARRSQADYARFLDLAFASARELDYQISLAKRVEYMSLEDADALGSLAEECLKVLRGLIRSLRAE